MLYRRFGRTELAMPVFSCGGMRYQYKWQDVPLAEVPAANQANLQATIRRSVELGINHIETARFYGSSERQLGLVLGEFPREKLIIQTKIKPEANPDDFVRNVEESLERLQVQYVDLLALHGINDAQTMEESVGRPGGSGGCLAAARQLQKRGLARHIGFSTHGPVEIIQQAIAQEAHGGFDYVNLHWYYIYQRNWAAILDAARKDMGVFIISPSDKGGMLYDPPAVVSELCQPLHPMVFNDLFCLSHPQVHTLSLGAARPGDFDRHLETLELLSSATQVLAPIQQRLEQRWNDVIPPALRDTWRFPSWDQTPGQINIPLILWLRNLVLAYDMHKYAKMRYNLLGSAGHWFPGLTAADVEEVDLQAIARQIGLDRQLVPLLQEAHQWMAAEKVKRLSES